MENWPSPPSTGLTGLAEGGVTLVQERGRKIFELSNHLGNVLVTISDRRIEHNTSGTTIDYNQAGVVSANDYYPFGMGMVERVYHSDKYRYSINGQEKEKDINENITSAEYWIYDSRIGRRWNIDPVKKEWESPYACFSNNPISYIDPYGDSDTAKYLTNAQLRDALKIGAEVVKKRVDAKTYNYWGEDDQNTLRSRALEYWKDHQDEMTFNAYAEFDKAVRDYHRGVASLAQWDGANEFIKLERSVINNDKLNDQLSVGISVGRIRQAEARWNAVWGLSMSSVGIGVSGGVGITTGSGPRAPIKSNSQQKIVDLSIRNKVPKNIHSGQQGKHIVGHNNYDYKEGRSILTADAQDLLNDFHAGRATILRQPNSNRVIVEFNRSIGTYIKEGKKTGVPTTRGTINFGKSGAHIVPSAPK